MPEIRNEEDLRKWLGGKPQGWMAAIAVRCALRVLPFIVSNVSGNESDVAIVALSAFRVYSFAWANCLYSQSSGHIPNSVAQSTIATAAAVSQFSSSPEVIGAVKSVGSAAYVAGKLKKTEEFPKLTLNAVSLAAEVVGLKLSEEAVSEVWRACERDANHLEHAGTVEDLMREDLWWLERPSWFVERLTEMEAEIVGLAPNCSIWMEWYDARIHGRRSFALPEEFARDIDIAISNQSNEWWDRSLEMVNADFNEGVEDAWRKVTDDTKHTLTQFILKFLEVTSKPASIYDVENASASAGYSASRPSVRGRLNELTKKGKILRVGRGIYAAVEQQKFFLSYSTQNEKDAQKVGGIVEKAGYGLFAQYKDMPPGSNFVQEMQAGLVGSDRLIALLSPEYVVSDHCQAEWSAAYAEDPRGKKRKIVPLLIKPAALPPLYKQIVYVPLYGLSTADAERKILAALDHRPPTAAQSRKVAAETVSPFPLENEAGQLDVNTNANVDAPYVDADLPGLPEKLRRGLNVLIGSLSNTNAPPVLIGALKNYRDELANGFDLDVTYLKDDMAIIEAEIAYDTDGIWHRAGTEAGLQNLRAGHSLIAQHYPLDMERERTIAEAPIRAEVFDSDAFKDGHQALVSTARVVVEEGAATEEFGAAIERRTRQQADIASLPDSEDEPPAELFVTDEHRVLPADVKKRFLFQTSGFVDGLLERGVKISKIADSDAGKAMGNAARKIIEAIWHQ